MERAIFATVLHRLMVSGSDRACERWLEAHRLDGAGGLELHHLYRAMSWLGEELKDQAGATSSARRTKDLRVRRAVGSSCAQPANIIKILQVFKPERSGTFWIAGRLGSAVGSVLHKSGLPGAQFTASPGPRSRRSSLIAPP